MFGWLFLVLEHFSLDVLNRPLECRSFVSSCLARTAHSRPLIAHCSSLIALNQINAVKTDQIAQILNLFARVFAGFFLKQTF